MNDQTDPTSRTGNAEIEFRDAEEALPRRMRTAKGNEIREEYERLEGPELIDEGVPPKGAERLFWVPQPIHHFIGSLVAEHGHRAATFLRMLRRACATKLKKYPKAREWQTVETFAKALDISVRQFYRVAEDAVKTGLVSVVFENRGGTAVATFTCDRRLAKLVDEEVRQSERRRSHFYDVRLARHVGINGALMYALIHEATREGVKFALQSSSGNQGYRYDGICIWAEQIAKVYPWMDRQAILYGLRRLAEARLIVRTERQQTGRRARNHFLYKVTDRDASRDLNQIAAALDAGSENPLCTIPESLPIDEEEVLPLPKRRQKAAPNEAEERR